MKDKKTIEIYEVIPNVNIPGEYIWDLKYTYPLSLNLNKTIIKYNFVQRDFPDYDELEIEFAAIKDITDLVPKSKEEIDNLNPLVIACKSDRNIIWFSFIINREYIKNLTGSTVIFRGVSSVFFEQNKVIHSNKDYSNFMLVEGGPELPDDFDAYTRTVALKTALSDILSNATKKYVYGGISTIEDPKRRIKGHSGYDIDAVPNTVSKNFKLVRDTIADAKEHLYNLFEVDTIVQKDVYNPDTKQSYTLYTTENQIDTSIVRDNSVIYEQIYELNSVVNSLYSHGNPKNYMTISNIMSPDFTSIEKVNDSSFITKDDPTYLVNTTNTLYNKGMRDLYLTLDEVSLTGAFIIFNVGDVISIEDSQYRIVQIKEENTIDGVKHSIEIKKKEVL